MRVIEVDESRLHTIDFRTSSISLATEDSSAPAILLDRSDLLILSVLLNMPVLKTTGASAAKESEALRMLALWAKRGAEHLSGGEHD